MPRKAAPIHSTNLTLRLKNSFYTIFILIQPETTLYEITQSLLNALRESYPTGLPVDPRVIQPNAPTIPLPQNNNEIRLGIPKDLHNLSQGFAEIHTDSGEEISQDAKSLGIKDGSILAFAFKTQETDVTDELFRVELPDLESLYGENA